MNPEFYEAFKAARAAAPSFASESYETPRGYEQYRGPDDGRGLARYAKAKAARLIQAAAAAEEDAGRARATLREAFEEFGHGSRPWREAMAATTAAEEKARRARHELAGGQYARHPESHGVAAWLRGPVYRGDGYYTNPWGESFRDESGLCFPVVYQLTGRRGVARFVAGYEFGGVDGGPSLDLSRIYTCDSEEDAEAGAKYSGAIRAAEDAAKEAAEEESEYQTAWRAGSEYAEEMESIQNARRGALAILSERRALSRKHDAAEAPAICQAIRGQVKAARRRISEARARMAELLAGDCPDCYFWPGEERLRAAFCEGAGLDSFPGRDD
ncbi:hypothetical protein [Synechococcus virus S-ESS1]|uniref:Uncharacterized protein n=1 Tax=Synechococcus virus S-ESS1 TaxID=1964565 RepID=A0A1V0DX55_9CAUD|nr:hypothetical protein JT310_gp49 [Synechococcus virus S-ESS1]ARB05744.1 hypothetical protein [Synechococcus virus S-ESS1]